MHVKPILIIGLTMLLVSMLSPTPIVHAATKSVACDVNALISAINTANATPGANVLELATNCTYTATVVNNTGDRGTNAFPQITGNITLNGHNTTIQRSTNAGTPMFRFFEVRPNGRLALNGITFFNANNDDIPNNKEKGGAIANFGTVNVANSTFSGGRAGCGAGIFSEGEWTVVTVVNSSFLNNTADV